MLLVLPVHRGHRESQALRAQMESLGLPVLTELLAQLVHKAQLVLRVLLVQQDLMGPPELPAHKEVRGLQVLMGLPAQRGPME